jgi:hypothetical protein
LAWATIIYEEEYFMTDLESQTGRSGKENPLIKQLVSKVLDFPSTGVGISAIILESGVDRPKFYTTLNECVVSNNLLKADIYFAFSDLSNEFEFILNEIGGEVAFMSPIELVELVDKKGLFGPLNKIDFFQYMRFRNCLSELINLIAEIERTTWFIVFDLIIQEYGSNWLLQIDTQMRKRWATMREDFRMGMDELPLHQFSSLADLRDIILNKRHWPLLSSHLPNKLTDKPTIKTTFNEVLIPTRNRLFHPTRELSLSFPEYLELKTLRETLDVKSWRNLKDDRMVSLSLAAPPPNWF